MTAGDQAWLHVGDSFPNTDVCRCARACTGGDEAVVLGIVGGSRTRTGAACRRPKGTVTEGQWSGRSGGAARVRAATLPALQRPTRGPDGRMVIRPFSHPAIQPSGPRTRPARGRVRWTDRNRLGGCG
ncbi:MAG: hypothetical protein ABGY24_16935 [bacterium]